MKPVPVSLKTTTQPMPAAQLYLPQGTPSGKPPSWAVPYTPFPSAVSPALSPAPSFPKKAASRLISAGPKRIEDRRTEAGCVSIIARHERQPVGQCGGREQTVDY